MAATGTKKAISSEDIQRKLIEAKIAKEEADLNTFRDGADKQIQAFMAQANAEIAARTGRIRAYKELLGLEPETDTTVPQGTPDQNGPGRPQEAPSGPEVPEAVHPVASAA